MRSGRTTRRPDLNAFWEVCRAGWPAHPRRRLLPLAVRDQPFAKYNLLLAYQDFDEAAAIDAPAGRHARVASCCPTATAAARSIPASSLTGSTMNGPATLHALLHGAVNASAAAAARIAADNPMPLAQRSTAPSNLHGRTSPEALSMRAFDNGPNSNDPARVAPQPRRQRHRLSATPSCRH